MKSIHTNLFSCGYDVERSDNRRALKVRVGNHHYSKLYDSKIRYSLATAYLSLLKDFYLNSRECSAIQRNIFPRISKEIRL